MSNYRDDTQETAVISDSTRLGFRSLSEDIARVAVSVTLTIGAFTYEAATLKDEQYSAVHSGIVESATMADSVAFKLSAKSLTLERAKLKDSAPHSIITVLEERATATEQWLDRQIISTIEQAKLTDETRYVRISRNSTTEKAKLSDSLTRPIVEQLEDSLTLADTITSRLKAKDRITEHATIQEQLTGISTGHAQFLSDKATLSDHTYNRLDAINRTIEAAWLFDEFMGGDIGGMAWTANTDNWAMSRYNNYSFKGLAVIDGVLYGTNDIGVFKLSNTEATSPINAKISTGKIDLSGGTLAHPVAAYIEHELVGNSELEITTTQNNTEETYSYPLIGKPADYLTSGRFIFGKGLRGRHFAISLNLNATKAHINDLRLEVEPVKRRV